MVVDKDVVLDRRRLVECDVSGMHHTYDQWPQIAARSYADGPAPLDMDGVSHIVFAGMGGSGALGDFFGAILSETDMHVSNVKGYNLPRTVNSDTLVVCTSVSGDTAETLTVLEKAARAPCRLVAVSSGGLMSKYCDKSGITCHLLQSHHSSRASFVSFLYGMMRLLEPATGMTARDVDLSLERLRLVGESINSDNLAPGNPALDLAIWIRHIPVVYYPWGLQAAATRFKSSLQESAKIHAMTEDVLETSHNGIVAWEMPTQVQPVLIQGPDDNRKTKERWSILTEYFGSNGIEYRVVSPGGGHIATKLIELVYTLDYCSIYLAVMRNVDPTPVDSISFVKERAGLGYGAHFS